MQLVLDPYTGLGVYQPVHESVHVPEQDMFEKDPSKRVPHLAINPLCLFRPEDKAAGGQD